MDWQEITVTVISVLLLFVWLPVMFLSVRKALRKNKKSENNKD